MAKTPITKAEALAFHGNWTAGARKAAGEHIKRVGATQFFDHGNYVSCQNKEGKVVMYLDSTRVQWRKEEFAPEGAEHNSSLYFEKVDVVRPAKEKAEKPAAKKASAPKKKVAVKKPTAEDVDAALADA